MTGEGGAVQMKNYLEKNAGLNGIQVIPLSISDRKALLNEVNRLREEHEIRCVIGTYDPGLHGIPFISVVKLFETPADKLDMLLTIPESDHTPVNYEMIFSYLSSQMPALDIKSCVRVCLGRWRRLSASPPKGWIRIRNWGFFCTLPAPSIGCKTVKPCRKRAIGRASSAATSACTTICERSCPGLKKHLTFVSRTMSSHI